MDERCEDAMPLRHAHGALNHRCKSCDHVYAVHGLDGMCDICALERRLRNQ